MLRAAQLALRLLRYMQAFLRTYLQKGVLSACRQLLGHDLVCLVSRLDSHPRQSAKQTLLTMAMSVLTSPCWHKLPLETALPSWGRPQSLYNHISQSCLLGKRRPHCPSSWHQQQMRRQLQGPRQAGRAVQATQTWSCLQLLRLGIQAQEW